MNNLISDYTIRSCVEKIINRSYDIRNVDTASISRDRILWTLWSWIISPEQQGLTADTDELINLLRREFGNDAVEDTGRVDGRQTYEIQLPNVRYHIVKLTQSYLINAVERARKHVYMSCKPPKEIVAYMRAFNDRIPDIHREIDKAIEKIAADNMICHISAISAKGIVDELIREGFNIPPLIRIQGTVKGRVVLWFDGMEDSIDSPLDHLKARLKRRFKA